MYFFHINILVNTKMTSLRLKEMKSLNRHVANFFLLIILPSFKESTRLLFLNKGQIVNVLKSQIHYLLHYDTPGEMHITKHD